MRIRLLLTITLLPFALPLCAAEPDGVPDYKRDIRPIFAAHCIECHGPDAQESGLRLDAVGRAIRGGNSGQAIIPGKAAESVLIKAVSGADGVKRMPPEGEPLGEKPVALLRAWIDAGAPIPQVEVHDEVKSDHWAFQRPVRAPLPQVADSAWPRNAIDHFVLTRLERAGIEPSPEAERTTLIRRLSLDLRGLPPSPAEVDRFLADRRPGAYARLVERMLASPHYGERWGRHWLDVARYADSNGYTRDFARVMWRYRDWVIEAINRDLPFDRFVIEQFAGDLLPAPTLDQLIATGFHRNTLINEEGGTDDEQFRVEAVADRVNTTGSALLGLTIGCARCHEHKYDPISQREYYELFAFFNHCEEPQIDAPTPAQQARGALERRAKIRKQIEELEQKLVDAQDRFDRKRLEWEATVTPELRRKLPGPLQASLDKQPEERTQEQQKLVADYYKTTEHARSAFPEIARIQELRASEPAIPTAMVLRRRSTPRETHIHLRGNFLEKGAGVEPDVPGVLPPLPADVERKDRLAFARWLTGPAHPLTARVTVNRIWQRYFGRGIVETENDFGTQGTPPSHPELLDWLALEFIDRGWSMKQMHRLIVTSATYRQSSRFRPDLAKRDPRNSLLARQSRLRLEAEIVRDAALAASGLLSRRIGGPSVTPPQPEGVFAFTQDPKPWKAAQNAERYRRGMYTFFWRSSPYPALMVFDFPNSNVTCTRRVRSNTPLQALTLANDIAFLECARALAKRVLNEAPAGDAARVRYAFRLGLARGPEDGELARLQALIAEQRAAFAADPSAAQALVGNTGAHDSETSAPLAERAAWTSVARVLMNLDEFITRE